MSDLPAAGWYPDPEHAGQQRYWDGQQWTEHRAPMADAGPPQWAANAGGTPAWSGAAAGGGMAQQNQKAVWALVLGILSLVCCGLVAGIPAAILGHQAKQEIGASHGRQTGHGIAQAGFVCGIIGTVLSVLGLVFYVVMIAVAGVGAGM